MVYLPPNNRIIYDCDHLQSQATLPWAGLDLHGWSALTSLNLTSTILTEAGAACLARSSLPELDTLALSFTRISDSAAAAIGKASLPKLQCAHLINTRLSVQGLEAVSKGQWPLLRRLDISHHLCGILPRYCSNAHWKQYQEHWRDPLTHSNWPLLQRLSAHNWSCIHLFTAAQECRWPGLEYLKTSCMHGKADAVLAHLEEVHLAFDHGVTASCSHGVRPECLDTLLAMHLPALQTLTAWFDPGHTFLTAAQMVKQDFPQLKALDLCGSNLGFHPMLPLLQTGWRHLTRLHLSDSLINEAALQVLVACAWPKLCNLDLSMNQIDHPD